MAVGWWVYWIKYAIIKEGDQFEAGKISHVPRLFISPQ